MPEELYLSYLEMQNAKTKIQIVLTFELLSMVPTVYTYSIVF